MAGTYLKLVLTMVIWGGTWVAGRYAVQAAPPLGIAVWRFLIASGALLALVAVRNGGLPRPTRREWKLIAGLSLTGIFLYNLCFLYGLQRLAAGQAALVVALNPVMAVLGAAWLQGEHLTPAKVAGSAIALVGCLTVIGHGSPLALLQGQVGFGELLIVGCALFWTIYTLIGRRATKTLSALVVTAYSTAGGCLLLFLAALFDDPAALAPGYPPLVWACILFLALLGTTLGFTWFNQSVARIGAARASIFINLVPVAAVLQGAWLLDERLGLPVLAGGALVLAGVVLTQRTPPQPALENSR
ncbi:MAG: DMT family transporter [Sterolibacteriaceae bacterium MAG5]|nr:DMT family transporter [Candidatus Nitricoxidireducens bremensis]